MIRSHTPETNTTNGGNGNNAGAATGAKARAPLPVRILMGVLAVATLAVAGLAGVNLVAVGQFNQATDTLTRNIKAIEQEDADLATLKASQQQTDAQFKDTASLKPVLLPDVRSSLETNTEVSRKLTALIERRLAEQQGSSGANDQSSDDSDNATANQRNNREADDSGLTDEQKAQVEQLLKANQQSTDTSRTTKKDVQRQTKENQTTKPW